MIRLTLSDSNCTGTDDVELGGHDPSSKSVAIDGKPPISIIIPVYRRDCQEEVYAGSHYYPGHGVYLLKFDNSYSLWRSKTLYYRVYYTRWNFCPSSSTSPSPYNSCFVVLYLTYVTALTAFSQPVEWYLWTFSRNLGKIVCPVYTGTNQSIRLLRQAASRTGDRRNPLFLFVCLWICARWNESMQPLPNVSFFYILAGGDT